MKKVSLLLAVLLSIFNSAYAGYFHIGALNSNLDISTLPKSEKLSIIIVSFYGCPPCKQLEINIDSIYHKTSLWDTNFVDVYDIDLRTDAYGKLYAQNDFKKTIRIFSKTININSFPNVFLFSFKGKFMERLEQESANLIEPIKKFVNEHNDCISSIKENNEDINDLNKKLQKEITVSNDLKGEIEMKTGIITNLNNDISEKKTANDSLSSTLKTKEANLTSINKELIIKTATNDSLYNVLKSKEIDLNRKKIINDSLSTLVYNNKQKIAAYDSLSIILKKKITTCDSLKNALDTRIKRQKEAIELLNK